MSYKIVRYEDHVIATKFGTWSKESQPKTQYLSQFIGFVHQNSVGFRMLCKLQSVTHKWPTPNVSGFIALLVRASHRNREVTGSNPVEVLNFSGFSTQL